MRVPICVNKNCLTTYEPPKNYAKKWQKRKIKSFDIENWDDKIPQSLQELCVECIAKNWTENPIIDEIILLEDRYLLLDLLSEDLPLILTIPKINYDIYWMKCYIKRWPKKLPNIKNEIEINQIVRNGVNCLNGEFLNNFITAKNKRSDNNVEGPSKIVSKASSRRTSRKSSITWDQTPKDIHKRTWKKYYIEMHVTEYLEHLKPENYEPEKIKDLCDLCGSSVEILQIGQMLTSENSSNKIPLNAVLTGFPNLRVLCLCFKQTYAVEDFSWNIVNVSDQDIKLFAKGLEKIRLQEIRITNSDIGCEKAIILLKALLKHDLEILDFSHCKIRDRGMMAISKFILENPVKEVLLANNRIGPNGVASLAYAVTQESCNIKILDLKLNQIFDDGGNILIKCIGHYNKTIKSLLLSGCGLSKNFQAPEMIKVNNVLEVFEISNNNLGEDTGERILAALAFNTTLKRLDLRMCRLTSMTEAKIQNEVHRNRKGLKKQENFEESPGAISVGHILWSEQMLADMEEILISETQENRGDGSPLLEQDTVEILETILKI